MIRKLAVLLAIVGNALVAVAHVASELDLAGPRHRVHFVGDGGHCRAVRCGFAAIAGGGLHQRLIFRFGQGALVAQYLQQFGQCAVVGANRGECQCGAKTCRGTVMGFSHLPRKQQEELKSFSWLRISPPYEGETRLVSTGDALSPHINRCMKKSLDSTDVTDCSDTAVCL